MFPKKMKKQWEECTRIENFERKSVYSVENPPKVPQCSNEIHNSEKIPIVNVSLKPSCVVTFHHGNFQILPTYQMKIMGARIHLEGTAYKCSTSNSKVTKVSNH